MRYEIWCRGIHNGTNLEGEWVEEKTDDRIEAITIAEALCEQWKTWVWDKATQSYVASFPKGGRKKVNV